MPNPIYILHITDSHFRKINAKEWSFSSINQYILVLKKFLLNKCRNNFDLVCITGDIMDRNAQSELLKGGPIVEYDYQFAIDFINKLKDSGVIMNSKIYSCPGNHDLSFEQAYKIEGLNELRLQYLLNYKKMPMAEIVDKNIRKLIPIFEKYEHFLTEINADNNISSIKGLNDHLYGCDIINFGGTDKFFISWFNTSWLCLDSDQWSELCLNPTNLPLKRTDHEIISPGYKIYKNIFKKLNELNENEIFKLNISHHEPRLMSIHDKSSKIKGYKPTYMEHLYQYNLVLNGHTHNRLHDRILTTGAFDQIPIIEINFNLGYYIQYELELNNLSKLKILNKHVVSYDNKKFFELIRSDYTSNDLLKDINLNSNQFEKLNNKGLLQNELDKMDREFEICSRNMRKN